MHGCAVAKRIRDRHLDVVSTVDAKCGAEIAAVVSEGSAVSTWKERGGASLHLEGRRLPIPRRSIRSVIRSSCGWGAAQSCQSEPTTTTPVPARAAPVSRARRDMMTSSCSKLEGSSGLPLTEANATALSSPASHRGAFAHSPALS